MDELGNYRETEPGFPSSRLRKSRSITPASASTESEMCVICTSGSRPERQGRSLPLRTSWGTTSRRSWASARRVCGSRARQCRPPPASSLDVCDPYIRIAPDRQGRSLLLWTNLGSGRPTGAAQPLPRYRRFPLRVVRRSFVSISRVVQVGLDGGVGPSEPSGDFGDREALLVAVVARERSSFAPFTHTITRGHRRRR